MCMGQRRHLFISLFRVVLSHYTGEELVNGHCPNHPSIIPDWLEEEKYVAQLGLEDVREGAWTQDSTWVSTPLTKVVPGNVLFPRIL